MHRRAPAGSLLGGGGAQSWLARSTSQAPCTVLIQSMPNALRTTSTDSTRKRAHCTGDPEPSLGACLCHAMGHSRGSSRATRPAACSEQDVQLADRLVDLP